MDLASGQTRQTPSDDGTIPYRFSSPSDFVRGYKYRFHRRYYKGALNYALPLFYPDKNFKALLHVKRVKLNGFYDYGRGGDRGQHTTYQAAGLELNFDFHLFSWPFPMDMGLRFAYRFKDDEPRWDFVVGSLGL